MAKYEVRITDDSGVAWLGKAEELTDVEVNILKTLFIEIISGWKPKDSGYLTIDMPNNGWVIFPLYRVRAVEIWGPYD